MKRQGLAFFYLHKTRGKQGLKKNYLPIKMIIFYKGLPRENNNDILETE
jgi:hypothetical protein